MGMEFSSPSKLFALHSPECCGWLQISGFPYALYQKSLDDLTELCTDHNAYVESDWSSVEDQEVLFPMYAVLIEPQKNAWHKNLISLGWEALTPFCNPNTHNTCYPYLFIPKELKVDVH